jgi:hypothetical protein
MKLFLNNLPMGDVSGPTRKRGEFFLRLAGFRVLVSCGNQSDGKDWASIEPIYIPLVRIHRQAGQILIEVNSDRPLAYITLQARRPFINMFRFPWDSLDNE